MRDGGGGAVDGGANPDGGGTVDGGANPDGGGTTSPSEPARIIATDWPAKKRRIATDSRGDVLVGSSGAVNISFDGTSFSGKDPGFFVAKYALTDLSFMTANVLRSVQTDTDVVTGAILQDLEVDSKDEVFLRLDDQSVGGTTSLVALLVPNLDLGFARRIPTLEWWQGPEVDRNDEMLLGVRVNGADFNGVTLAADGTVSPDGRSAAVALNGSDGSGVWATRALDNRMYLPEFVASDRKGHFVIAGEDGSVGPDLFINVFDTVTQKVLSTRVIVTDGGQPLSPAALGDVALVGDSVVVAGTFSGTLDLGGKTLSYAGTASSVDATAFVASYKVSDGSFQWGEQFDPFDDVAAADKIDVAVHRVVRLDDTSFAVVASEAMGSSNHICGNSRAVLVRRFDLAGTHVDTQLRRPQAPPPDCPNSFAPEDAAATPDGRLVVLGTVNGPNAAVPGPGTVLKVVAF